MRLFFMVAILVIDWVVVTVNELCVVVCVRVPIAPVFELVADAAFMMMGYVPMVMAVSGRGMRVSWGFPLAIRRLPNLHLGTSSLRFRRKNELKSQETNGEPL